MPRECLICGKSREDQNEEVIFDYCSVCLETDVGLLREIQLRRKMEASLNLRKDTKEA